MNNILGLYLMPHPPIIIPEIGKGEEKKIQKTIDSCMEIGREIQKNAPETIVLITPHGLMFNDAIAISSELEISGNLKAFRAQNIKINKDIDINLTNEIIKLSKEEDITTVPMKKEILKKYNRMYELDHGTIVPLYFVNHFYNNYKLVHITYGILSDIELYKFGMLIKKAINRLNIKTVIIASGDLSHRLSDKSPYEYSPNGKIFDEKIISLLQNGEIEEIFKFDNKLIEEAGECGLRSIYILLGSLDGYEFKGNLLSYENTFGVGYGVMKFLSTNEKKNFLKYIINERLKIKIEKENNSDMYVKLAKESIIYFLRNDEEMEIPKYLPEEMLKEKAGVFVSLHKLGNLRGCIGTFLPTTNCIAEEIIKNAIEAAINDPRFNPVSEKELSDIDLSVDVLTKPIKADIKELNPHKYGVIVTQGKKRGLLLPDLEGVDTIKRQLEIACGKAGIDPNSKYEIEKFTVIRHIEGDLIDKS